MGIGVVGVGGIGDLIGRWDSTERSHSVQNSGIHLKITAGRPIGVPQTVVDDPGDFPVVLRGGLALHNRGLGQHGLIVRLRHAQILKPSMVVETIEATMSVAEASSAIS